MMIVFANSLEKEMRDENTLSSIQMDSKLKSMTYELEHNLGVDGSYTPRNSLVVDLIPRLPRVQVMEYRISLKEKKAFNKIQEQNGLYSFRTRPCPDCSHVIASIPACLVAQTQFQYDLLLHLDQSGALVALEHRIPSQFHDMVCTMSRSMEQRDMLSDKMTFKITGRVIETQKGPSILHIDGAKIPVPAGMKAVKTPGEVSTEEQPSFLRKYWYIILPLVLVTVFTGEPEQQQRAAAQT